MEDRAIIADADANARDGIQSSVSNNGTTRTAALAMTCGNNLREKVGFVKFASTSTTDKGDGYSEDDNDVVLSSSSTSTSLCWPAVIFEGLEDFKRHSEESSKYSFFYEYHPNRNR